MLRYLFVCFLLIRTLDVSAQTTVFLIDDTRFRGECAQRQGVLSALRAREGDAIKHHELDLKEGDFLDDKGRFSSSEKREEFLKKLEDQAREACREGRVILVSGHQYGAEIFKNLPGAEGVIKVLTAHQMWASWRDLTRDQVDYVCLPSHVDPKFSSENSPQVISTAGVSYALTSGFLEEAYNKACQDGLMTQELQSSQKPCLLVILGGDVQDDQGRWHPYTKAEAKNLVSLIQNLTAGNPHDVIVVDGPRTGRHLEKIEGAPNGVTQAFLEALDEHGIPHDEFLFKVPGKPSLHAALGLINQRGGMTLVPGESTSMISEVIGTRQEGKRVVLYQHSAMLLPHIKHVETESQFKDVSLFRPHGEVWEQVGDAAHDAVQVREPAAETIAKSVLEEDS